MQSPHEGVTLAVLAGGQGSRMGRPKAMLQLGGRPILEYLLDRFAWPGVTLLVTAPGREHPPGWQRFDGERSDPAPGQGPLRGILTALENSRTPRLIIATVDMPNIRHQHLQWLVDHLDCSGAKGVMCRCCIEAETQIEPFPLALSRESQPIIRSRLDAGKRWVLGLLEERDFVSVDAPADWDRKIWLNLNAPEDLARLDPAPLSPDGA